MAAMDKIFQCASDNWSPTIGDPTPLGWITVLAYFVSAFLAGLALRVAPRKFATERNAYLRFWWFMIVLLTFLGVNKQMDLQTFFAAVARCIAIKDGWYADRQGVQISFILLVIAGACFGMLSIFLYFRKSLSLVRMAAIGLLFLIAFVAIRAVSIHHIDRIIGSHILGLRINGLLELTGILLISFNASWLAVTRSKT